MNTKLRKRKRRIFYRNSKFNKIKPFIPCLLLLIGIGFSSISSLLGFGGSVRMKSGNMWDIHFANVQLVSNTATITSEAQIDETDLTKLNFGVKLFPGTQYSFTVDVVNDGTIDAAVSAIEFNGLTDSQKEFINYTVTYSDGTEISIDDILISKNKVTLLVTIEYFRKDKNSTYLPSQDLNLSFKLSYVQRYDASTIGNSYLDVHFENIVVKTETALVTKQASVNPGNPTQINFKLKYGPGTEYTFEVDIVNSGKYDAEVYSTVIKGLTELQKKYIDYTITYSNGQDILIGDIIPSGESVTILVTTKFSKDLAALNEIKDDTIDLGFYITFTQTDDLDVPGNSNLDVHFENIAIKKETATVIKKAGINPVNPTQIGFAIKYGINAEYTFEVDVVNSGKYDAKVSSVSINGLTDAQKKYINYTVTYNNGQEVLAGDIIPSGKKLKLLVSTKFSKKVEALDALKNQTITLGFSMNFAQNDDPSGIKTHDGIYFDNITTDNSDSVEQRNTSINLFDPTRIDFSISLRRGQSYSFEFDVVNESKNDVKVSTSEFEGLTTEQSQYLNVSAKYSDDTKISANDVLKAGESQRIKITIKYVNGLDESLYKTTNESINLSYKISYIQE